MTSLTSADPHMRAHKMIVHGTRQSRNIPRVNPAAAVVLTVPLRFRAVQAAKAKSKGKGKSKGAGKREWGRAVWEAEYGSSFASEVAPIPSVTIIALRTGSAGSASSAGRTWTVVAAGWLVCSLDRLTPPPVAVGARPRGGIQAVRAVRSSGLAEGLNAFAHRLNPILGSRRRATAATYWVIDQAEIATDVMFKSRPELLAIWPDLVRHATLNPLLAEVRT